MARYIPDAKSRRWVIIAPRRNLRPDEMRESEAPEEITKPHLYHYKADCPFCFGNEKKGELRIIKEFYDRDNHWLVRSVVNKYPITDIHEVIIHSPDHLSDITDFDQKQLKLLFLMYRHRFRALSSQGQVLIFNNKGAVSGESLLHPHSQIVVFPQQVKIDVLAREPVKNIVSETTNLVVYCPDFSQSPYETWIGKKTCLSHQNDHKCLFGDIADEEAVDLGEALQNALKKLLAKVPDLSYNFYIYPFGCWYLRIIPRLTIRGGLELGTGIQVNPVDPALAASELSQMAV